MHGVVLSKSKHSYYGVEHNIVIFYVFIWKRDIYVTGRDISRKYLECPWAGEVPKNVGGGAKACKSCGVTPSSELNRLYICLSLPAILQE